MTTFDESKHARAQDGKFTHTPHAEGEGVTLAWQQPARDAPLPVQQGMFMRADTPRDVVVAQLTGDPEGPIGRHLWGHPALSVADLLTAMSGHHHTSRTTGLATQQLRGRLENPNLPANQVEELAASNMPPHLRLPALTHPNLPAHVADRLKHSPQLAVRQALANNPATNPTTLTEYLEDDAWGVRRAAAANPNLPQAHIPTTSGDTAHQLGVAANPNTPPQTLTQLDTTNVTIAEQVASNPNTPTATLTQLADHADAGVRTQVAANPNTPHATVDRLVSEGDAGLRRVAAGNPNLSEYALIQVARDHPVEALTHPNIGVGMALGVLFNDESTGGPAHRVSRVTRAAAHVTNPDVLDALGGATLQRTRRAVANNPNTPTATLQRLTRDTHQSVADAAMRTLTAKGPMR